MSSTRLSAHVEGTSQVAQQYRLWAKVEYDGTDFYGFQIQTRERTVQGELERALRRVAGTKTRVIGAGRTDRGVHAQGQIISFEVEWKHDLADLQRALNAVLAADVAIVELGLATRGFHPRFSALSRTYRYAILNRFWRSPWERRTAWHVPEKLDVGRMEQASCCLRGTHDFATFGRPLLSDNTVRTVHRTEWQEQGSLLMFDIEANAFLYRMVRSIVGMVVQVGRGKLSPDDFEATLRARDRSLIRQLAPAHGLCLIRVDYPKGVLQ